MINRKFIINFFIILYAIIFFTCTSPVNGSGGGGGSNLKTFPIGAGWIAPPAVPSFPTSPTIFYVSKTGSDLNSGSIASPFATLTKAISSAAKGEVIYVRAGTYNYTSSISLSKSGDGTNYFFIWAFPGESPVIDFNGESYSSQGFYITGNYWYIKGFEIKNASKSAVRITGSYNIIENCIIHDNKDAGLYIGLNKDDGTPYQTDGTKAAFNQVINCDSYMNVDLGGSTGDGGNADGFACKLNPGNGNYFKGCRSWSNSDDGWDLYLADYPVMIENCWTWHNGDPSDYGYSGSAWAGNGNGFKVGGGDAAKSNEHYSHGRHILKNCIAFDMNYGNTSTVRAFDRNNNHAGVAMYNCLAFNSKIGFYFSTEPDDGSHHILKNCAVFGCTTYNYNLSSGTIHDHNSWDQSGITADSSDFMSILTADAKAPRESDGSLPNNNFGRLTASSDLIDKGTDVGISYLGSAPDLGAFEKQ